MRSSEYVEACITNVVKCIDSIELSLLMKNKAYNGAMFPAERDLWQLCSDDFGCGEVLFGSLEDFANKIFCLGPVTCESFPITSAYPASPLGSATTT